LATSVMEPAGEISWTSNSNATVHFGISEVNVFLSSNCHRFSVAIGQHKGFEEAKEIKQHVTCSFSP
jgi:hypothetical protein